VKTRANWKGSHNSDNRIKLGIIIRAEINVKNYFKTLCKCGQKLNAVKHNVLPIIFQFNGE